jgi:hypothetical protein
LDPEIKPAKQQAAKQRLSSCAHMEIPPPELRSMLLLLVAHLVRDRLWISCGSTSGGNAMADIQINKLQPEGENVLLLTQQVDASTMKSAAGHSGCSNRAEERTAITPKTGSPQNARWSSHLHRSSSKRTLDRMETPGMPEPLHYLERSSSKEDAGRLLSLLPPI